MTIRGQGSLSLLQAITEHICAFGLIVLLPLEFMTQ